ncbi:MAG: hypothetical protein M1827_002062 [Pycnora praestabilis]|nr:MAG: hypothetical protein M1827_002062 [Pycnora praestabilis]
MNRSADAGHFFQTEKSLEETRRKAAKFSNAAGDPIRLSSKVLAITSDPAHGGQLYVAESAGTTGEKGHIYRGPGAPVTCLAISADTIFAGCWDKTVWSWTISTRQARRRYVGHTDFVKTVLYLTLGGKEILMSGSADASIIVWDVNSGDQLHVLKGHTRGVHDLALDPITSSPDKAIIFSASSDPEIRRWSVSLQEAAEVDSAHPIGEHETSVFKIRFDAYSDLWTASADNTVKCLSRDRGWKTDTTLVHPDFVRDVATDEDGGWIITGCRDEDVRIWNRGTGELHHVFPGHSEEVTGLLLLGRCLLSVSIDATIRKWSLKPRDLENARRAVEAAKTAPPEPKQDPVKEPLLTEDEERELADLMDGSE